MEQLNKLDRNIWRINGIALLCIFIASFVGIIFMIFGMLKNVDKSHDFAQVDKGTKEEKFLRLGYFHKLKGTEFLLVPLTSDKSRSSYGKLSSEYYSKDSRNQLLFNEKTQESTWLWESNDNLITEVNFTYDNPEEKEKQIVSGIAFEFIASDTNKSDALDENDRKSVNFFNLKDLKMHKIISEVDRIIGMQQTTRNEVFFFYSKSGKSFFKSYNLINHDQGIEKEILLPIPR